MTTDKNALQVKLQRTASSLRTVKAISVNGPGPQYAEWFEYLFIAGTAMKKALFEQSSILPPTVKEWLSMMVGEFEGIQDLIGREYKKEAYKTACKKENPLTLIEGKLADFRSRLIVDANKTIGGEKLLLTSLASAVEQLRQKIVNAK